MSHSNPQSQWFAVNTRSQREKMVAFLLHSKGYEEFLPLYETRRRWSDRMKAVEKPLFPGYVFCRFEVEKRLPILLTPGVCCIAGIGKTPLPVEEREIAALQSIVQSGLKPEPWPYLQVGQRVRILRGALEGIEGLLIGVKKHCRLVVSVTLLQRSVAVEIEADAAMAASSRLSTPMTAGRLLQYSPHFNPSNPRGGG